MNQAEFAAKPERFWIGEEPWTLPLALVELDADLPWPEDVVLPPCPIIGLGQRDAPGGGLVDAVIEAPAQVAGVMAQVIANPRAAAIVVQLLRLLPSLDVQQGLTAESLAYATLQGSAEHRAWLARQLEAPGVPAGSVRLLRTDNVLEIMLDRPEAGNAIDRIMRDALYDAFQTAALDPSIERVILRGEGRVFSLGADLAEFGTTTDPATAHEIRAFTLPAHMAARIGDRLEAWVQGGCIGSGLELAALAQRIVARPTAWFQLPELAMGVLPGAGGCVSLTRRIGRQRTALMILSGKRVSARTALEWGLIDAIVDDFA
jgi:enoyl-CoA hydratase